MTLYNTLKSFLTEKEKSNEVPEGLCPNCWGRQEYQGKFFEAVKREGIDTENITEKKGWIQAYAEKNLTGIELKHAELHNTCASCGLNYVETK